MKQASAHIIMCRNWSVVGSILQYWTDFGPGVVPAYIVACLEGHRFYSNYMASLFDSGLVPCIVKLSP